MNIRLTNWKHNVKCMLIVRVIYLWMDIGSCIMSRLGTCYRVLLTDNNIVSTRRQPKWFVSFPMVFCFLFCFESANKNPHPHRVLYTIKLQKTLNNNDRYNVYLHRINKTSIIFTMRYFLFRFSLCKNKLWTISMCKLLEMLKFIELSTINFESTITFKINRRQLSDKNIYR